MTPLLWEVFHYEIIGLLVLLAFAIITIYRWTSRRGSKS